MSQRRELYPAIEAFDAGFLQVSPLHRIYFEQSGNPRGQAVICLHGGPGSGSSPKLRRFFDPAHYRVVQIDQRGSGRSTPHAELRENTTWDLVADIEAVRQHLGIDRWLVFGGSWGSTLGLAYAQSHPSVVRGLILRGIFMLRRFELTWFYQQGASWLFPDAFEDYIAPIPLGERGDLMSAYYRRLTGDDSATRLACARAWSVWEARLSFMTENADYVGGFDADERALSFARIECHYFVHGGFFRRDDQLLADMDRIRHLPGVIVHGRYDVVCPPVNAWDLHRAWPNSELKFVSDAGHSGFEPGIAHELVSATDRFRDLR